MKNKIPYITGLLAWLLLLSPLMVHGQAVSDGLVAYYPFSGDATDGSGNGNNGTTVGDPQLSTDRLGNANSAYEFDSVDDYLQTPATNSLDALQQGSFSAWVYLHAVNEGAIFSYAQEVSSNSNIHFGFFEDRFRVVYKFEGSNTPFIESTSTFVTNQWYHITVVADGVSLMKLYINGTEDVATFTSSNTAADGTEWFADLHEIGDHDHSMVIGANLSPGFGNAFDGLIDDVYVFDRALSQGEITALYLEGVPKFTSFFPTAATVGSTVMLYGANFSTTIADNYVYFDSQQATVLEASASALTVQVPADVSGPVHIIISIGEPLFFDQGVQQEGEVVAQTRLFTVLRGAGVASFRTTEEVITTNALNPRGVAVADMDEDGVPDVLSSSIGDGGITWYDLGIGGIFQRSSVQETAITTSAGQPFALYAADIDADGDMDVVAGTAVDNSVAWYENTEFGSQFNAANVITTNADGGRMGVRTADLNGDGTLDVLSASEDDDIVAWYANTDGDGTFGSQQVITTLADGPIAVRAADLDGDHDLDVVVGSVLDGSVTWYENTDGLGTFALSQTLVTGDAALHDIDVADIDGDGDLDVLSAALNSGNIAWYENTDGMGTFGSQQVIALQGGPLALRAGDIDNDGDADVVAGSFDDNTIAWYENTDGMGTFGSQQRITSSATAIQAIELGDLDNDGDLDVIWVADTDSKVAWIRNDLTAIAVPTPDAAFYWPLDTATVDIYVTEGFNMIDFSAFLAFDADRTTFIEESLAPGSIFGDGLFGGTYKEFEPGSGSLLFGAFSLQSFGESGPGTVATMDFAISDFATPGSSALSLSDIESVDLFEDFLSYVTMDSVLEIGGVWPGDIDNNCVVEAADLLPIGLLLGTMGTARQGAMDITWGAKAFSPWDTLEDSFADATGDGTIDQKDVLAIGVNFDEVHEATTGCTPDGAGKRGQRVVVPVAAMEQGAIVEIQVALDEPVASLLGAAFTVSVDPAVLSLESFTIGSLLGETGNVLEMVRLDATTGKGQAAFSRMGPESAVDKAGEVALLRLKVVGEMTADSNVRFDAVQLSTVSDGVIPGSAAVTLTAQISTGTGEEALPMAFTLHGAYPNPFNPTTTIAFDLPERAAVTLTVYDVLGRVVRRTDVGEIEAGSQRTIRFDAEGLGSGVYLYRLEMRTGAEVRNRQGRFVFYK